jgi:tetratricopeptide (TPR) repeat protein
MAILKCWPFKKENTFKYLSIFCVLIFCFTTSAMAQSGIQNAQSSVDPNITALAKRLEDIQQLFNIIGIAFTVFGGMAAIAGIIGLISWIRGEQKFSSLYAKVSANIDLVNTSLTISNETLDQAAKANFKQAQRMRREIDQAAREFIHEKHSDRNIIRTIGDKSILVGLYERIQNYKSFTLQFDDEEKIKSLDLTTCCFFIMGLEHNFRQNYDISAQNLKLGSNLVDEGDVGDAIQFKCLYWLAMVLNNSGQFPEAEAAMSRALAIPDLAFRRRIEAKRLMLESRFFNTALSQTATINDFRKLENDTANDVRETRTSVKITYGNVLLGMFLADPARPIHFVEAARDQFQEVNSLYPTGSPIWSDLGLALSLTAIHGSAPYPSTITDLYNGIVNKSDAALQTKFEERSKLLLHSAKFISLKRLGNAEANSARQAIVNSVGQIDEHAYLFSQVSMRNVTRNQFIREIDTI